MTRIEVHRATFRGDPERSTLAEFVIADALRGGIPDDGKLVLVRRLGLGRISLRGSSGATVAGAAWREATSSARHGGAAGAETANCVWFADAAEARVCLLRELARGRRPDAWFWSLAVPDWGGLAIGRYLEGRIIAALRETSPVAIATVIDEIVAADCTEAFVSAFMAVAMPGATMVPELAVRASPERPFHPAHVPSSSPPPAEEKFLDLAAVIVARIHNDLKPLLRHLALSQPSASTFDKLVAAVVRRAHPALALAPAVATGVEKAVRLAITEPHLFTASGQQLATQAEGARGANSSIGWRQGSEHRQGLSTTPRIEVSDSIRPHDLRAMLTLTPRAPGTQSEPSFSREEGTRSAGLFLVLVPLVHIGWREWLAERPEFLTHRPGPRLLRAIAAHYRTEEDDPVWKILPDVDRDPAPPDALLEGLAHWRKGLDGWLRRRAGTTLSRLVRKPGWVLAGGETTTIRMPLNSIDMGLRRLALDRDPGWVDWLGHSYRLIFADRREAGGIVP